MPVFNDSENLPPRKLVAAGDYTFCVIAFEIAVQSGGKTSGSECYEIEFEIEGQGSSVPEKLIDHPTTGWKIDTFLKAAGVKLVKGQSFSFREDQAKAEGLQWINPIGLRGPFRVVQESYEKNGEKKTVNKVATFYTDRPKLPPNEALRANKAAAAEQAEEDKPF